MEPSCNQFRKRSSSGGISIVNGCERLASLCLYKMMGASIGVVSILSSRNSLSNCLFIRVSSVHVCTLKLDPQTNIYLESVSPGDCLSMSSCPHLFLY